MQLIGFYLDLSFESDLSFSFLLDSDLLVSSLTTSVDLDPPVAVFIGEGRSVDFSTLEQGYINVQLDQPCGEGGNNFHSL